MNFKSRLKTLLFQILDKLPSKVGYDLYHQVQKRFTASFESKFKANQNTAAQIVTLLEQCKFNLGGKNVLEIGSGWMPIMPYLLKQMGNCKLVHTYDINNHFDNNYIDQLNDYFKSDFKVDWNFDKSGLHIPGFVKYYPNNNVITSILPNNADLIFSRFVLEHVTPSDLVDMHKRFAAEYESNTHILHFISPSDHRAYSDSSISHYDFLKYSQPEWKKIQTKFDYHNRLRLPQYLKIFEETGFEVVYLDYDKVDPQSKKYALYEELNIHADFAGYSEEEILAGSIVVLLKKKEI